jgi:hypothetical protein
VGERTLVVTSGAVGAAMLAMAVVPGLPPALALLAAAGVSVAMFNTASNALLQRTSRGEFHGRVMAAFSALFVGSKGLGGALAGTIAGTWGPRAGLAVGACGCFGAMATGRLLGTARTSAGGRDMSAVEWTDPSSEFAAFERLAHARRSSLLIDRDRPVPRDLVDRLCKLVYSAPNHKRTVPWQIAVFVGCRADPDDNARGIARTSPPSRREWRTCSSAPPPPDSPACGRRRRPCSRRARVRSPSSPWERSYWR